MCSFRTMATDILGGGTRPPHIIPTVAAAPEPHHVEAAAATAGTAAAVGLEVLFAFGMVDFVKQTREAERERENQTPITPVSRNTPNHTPHANHHTQTDLAGIRARALLHRALLRAHQKQVVAPGQRAEVQARPRGEAVARIVRAAGDTAGGGDGGGFGGGRTVFLFGCVVGFRGVWGLLTGGMHAYTYAKEKGVHAPTATGQWPPRPPPVG